MPYPMYLHTLPPFPSPPRTRPVPTPPPLRSDKRSWNLLPHFFIIEDDSRQRYSWNFISNFIPQNEDKFVGDAPFPGYLE